jgi:hypothetical protein
MMAWYAQHPDGRWPLGDGTVPDSHRMWADDGSLMAEALEASGMVEVHAPGQPSTVEEPVETPLVTVDGNPAEMPALAPARKPKGERS